MADLEGRLLQLEKTIAKLGDVDALATTLKKIQGKIDDVNVDLEGRLLQFEKTIANLGDVDALATTLKKTQGKIDSLGKELVAVGQRVDRDMETTRRLSNKNRQRLLQLEKTVAQLGDVEVFATTMQKVQSRMDDFDKKLATAVQIIDRNTELTLGLSHGGVANSFLVGDNPQEEKGDLEANGMRRASLAYREMDTLLSDMASRGNGFSHDFDDLEALIEQHNSDELNGQHDMFEFNDARRKSIANKMDGAIAELKTLIHSEFQQHLQGCQTSRHQSCHRRPATSRSRQSARQEDSSRSS
jgi:hypothetical protein